MIDLQAKKEWYRNLYGNGLTASNMDMSLK